jgi:hypothetical protein
MKICKGYDRWLMNSSGINFDKGQGMRSNSPSDSGMAPSIACVSLAHVRTLNQPSRAHRDYVKASSITGQGYGAACVLASMK